MDASAITALLGPTNTGKTHRAVERMLEHGSGMIGLPLRLLAREVYDKVSARVGESAVALVTGEEQRIPPRPAYWVSTVEAMPVEREVDFVAIDEVQLARNEHRGHVFTSRILSLRGRKETWFLGAETMRNVLGELTPTAKVMQHPRLSRLTFAGSVPLPRVPPRSAVVAFSTPHVYELAERIRARKGGAAVVLGGLSPRTRNAQVAMFEAGEVDYLVATDAIGMGLNLGVTHVAFASLRKFDGSDVRELEDSELAQIAGRAGRWIENGTFGTLAPLDLPPARARAIEDHRFESVRRVRWRNDRLDFASIEALRASLSQKPARGVLEASGEIDDARVLRLLARREEIVKAARGEERVRLLWDVCTVPDFRKLLIETHADFLAELYLELVREGQLGDDWIRERVRGLDDTSGDVETLVARIAAIRTWTYVANRASWLTSPREWSETTHDLEDHLSDALHGRLVLRFVDAKKSRSKVRARAHARAPSAGESPVELAPTVEKGHPFAGLLAMRGAMVPDRANADATTHRWWDSVVEAQHGDFRLEETGRIVHIPTERPVAALVRGATIALPDVRLVEGEDKGAGAKSRLQRRIVAFARDVVSDLLGPLRPLAGRDASSAVRGLVHRLEQGLGTAKRSDVDDLVSALSAADRAALSAAHLTLGVAVVFVSNGLRGEATRARVALASLFHETRGPLLPPRGGAVSFVPSRGVDPRAFTAIGYPVFGPRAIRCDLAERVAARLHDPVGPDPVEVANWLGCPARDVPRIIAALRAEPGASALSSAGAIA